MINLLVQEPISLIWDAIPAGVIAVDSACRIVCFNKGAEALFGITRDEALTKHILTMHDTCRVPLEHDYWIKAVNEQLVTPLQEKTFSVNGISIHVEIIVTPTYTQEGETSGAFGIINNIDRVRNNELRMQHLETLAAIGQVAAGTVHEIRNPLTSIKGFTQLIQHRAERQNNSSLSEYCTLICDEIDHINTIVSNFLTLSRPHNKQFEKLDIVTVTGDVLAFMYGESLLAGITILYQPPSHPIDVYGYLEKIKELLINLCRNAFQAMKPGGTLSVTITTQVDTVTIDISDTGCGMTELTMQHLFEAFYTTKETGTGLGLSICKRIAQEHNGDIHVTSKIGAGSTFSVVLPLL